MLNRRDIIAQRDFSVAELLEVLLPVVAEVRAPSKNDLGEVSTGGSMVAVIDTSLGTLRCKLDAARAPVAVANFVGLASGAKAWTHPATGETRRGVRYYDGLIFHRVIPDFMIQGGDPLGTGMGGPKGPGFPFKDEFVPTLKFDVPGRLAMANSGPNTNGSQFFITEVPTPHLNNRHTIFGQCGNLDVVKAIARVPGDQDNRPRTPVHMQRVVIERVGPAPPDAPEAPPGGPAEKGPGNAPAKSAGKPPAKNS